MAHFGIFYDSIEFELAIENGDLARPYVVLVSGELDYNSMASWSNDGIGNYVMVITETDPTYWQQGYIQIGTLNNVYYNDTLYENAAVLLSHDNYDGWQMKIQVGSIAETTYHEGMGEDWYTGIFTTLGENDSVITVIYDGNNSFFFHTQTPNHPINMTTINPPYPSA